MNLSVAGLAAPGEPVEFVKNEICRCVGHVLGELTPEYAEALRIVDTEPRPIGSELNFPLEPYAGTSRSADYLVVCSGGNRHFAFAVPPSCTNS